MTVTVNQVIKDAFAELNVYLPGEDVNPDNAAFAIRKLNRILDDLNAERAGVYAEQQETFTITPELQPHTIGPTGATFTVAQRPVSIEGASIVLSGSAPNANIALNIRDFQWWQAVIVPTVDATVPSDLYYQPLYPNGAIYLWPVPNTAYGLLLQWRIALSAVTPSSSLILPPGYIDAIVLTLAEELSTSQGRAVPPQVAERARYMRARVMANNDVTPSLVTQDSGIPVVGSGPNGNRADFNYLNGSVV